MQYRQITLLRLGQAAEYLFGTGSEANKARLRRLSDSGVMACVRLGPKRIRHYSTAELDRLLDGGEVVR